MQIILKKKLQKGEIGYFPALTRGGGPAMIDSQVFVLFKNSFFYSTYKSHILYSTNLIFYTSYAIKKL